MWDGGDSRHLRVLTHIEPDRRHTRPYRHSPIIATGKHGFFVHQSNTIDGNPTKQCQSVSTGAHATGFLIYNCQGEHSCRHGNRSCERLPCSPVSVEHELRLLRHLPDADRVVASARRHGAVPRQAVDTRDAVLVPEPVGERINCNVTHNRSCISGRHHCVACAAERQPTPNVVVGDTHTHTHTHTRIIG